MGARIKKRRLELDLTQKTLAARVGVSRVAVTYWESGQTGDLDGANLLALAVALERSPEWIKTGKDPKPGARAANQDEYATIRLRNAKVAAGSPAVNDYDNVVGGLKFLSRSLRSRGLSVTTLEVIFAQGDSMSPRIFSGDVVMVDTSQTVPKHGRVFAFTLDGEGEIVKRLQRTEGGWQLVSDNNAGGDNPPIPVRADWRGCRIIGRVVWTGGWMP